MYRLARNARGLNDCHPLSPLCVDRTETTPNARAVGGESLGLIGGLLIAHAVHQQKQRSMGTLHRLTCWVWFVCFQRRRVLPEGCSCFLVVFLPFLSCAPLSRVRALRLVFLMSLGVPSFGLLMYRARFVGWSARSRYWPPQTIHPRCPLNQARACLF